MAVDMSQFFRLFFDEADEMLGNLEKLLLSMDVQAVDMEDINALFRVAHTIKGGASTFGFDDLIEITHAMESMLDQIRHGQANFTPAHQAAFLQAKDVLKMQVDGLRQGSAVDAAQVAQVRAVLAAMAQQAPVAAQQPVAAPPPTDFVPASSAPESEDFELFEPFPSVPATPAHDAVDGAEPPTRKVPAKAEAVAGSIEASTIRVNIDKVDQLLNLVGELVITQAMLVQRSQTLASAQHGDLLNGISQLSRNTRDLQDSVMSIRMMPMDFVFSRFPRMVHELSSKLGKSIQLVTEGDSTELDKGLIEKIIDPLTHLVRNSIDHGIEVPALREKRGKSETGQIRLCAMHQGGHIVIEVHDDGAGLDRGKIVAKARSQGRKIEATATDEEVWQLIFLPGFSTAEIVTDVSGRGVGMDVVKRNIHALGGTVSVSSRAGLGSTIRISLPLTMAILDGMSVRVGSETYMLPLSNVVESFRPPACDIKGMNGQGWVVHVRGEYLPVISLAEVFHTEARSADPASGILVVLATETGRAALWVDELVGQQQVVVKNIETNYRKVANVSGATILGDGCVSLIVDVGAILSER